ncbi:MAG: hypothetical protein TR69_WS6001000297 [candidate division WS6 bacterium OLB20]|uniref:Translocation protein TolB n=1 Tax=candidate division WS6 bacterium OLB20 TaxID=1617426 RepID=A0A136M0J5_9BACT|nr:MAG: hypothetical protein TR69_WS6001000297 [candidate division WS6 bacterium OLB20]
MFDLVNGSQEPVYTAPEGLIIEAAGWSHDGEILIVLENSSDSRRTFRQVLPEQKVLKEYAPVPGRGIDPQDQVGVHFSNDDTVVALVNTYSGEKETIALHSRDGSEIKTINGQEERLPAFPAFRDRNTMFYRFGPSLREVQVQSQTGIYGLAVSQPFTGMNLALSGNGLYLAYWDIEADGSPYLGLYSTSSGTAAKLTDGYGYPQWLSSDTVLALEVSVREGSDFLQTGGLASIDRASGGVSLLVDAVVSSYALE